MTNAEYQHLMANHTRKVLQRLRRQMHSPPDEPIRVMFADEPQSVEAMRKLMDDANDYPNHKERNQ